MTRLQRRLLRALDDGPATVTELTTSIYGPPVEQDHRKRAYREWEAQWIQVYWALDDLRLTGDLIAIPTATSQIWCTPAAAGALGSATHQALTTWIASAPALEAT